jgi:hypothetical protein
MCHHALAGKQHGMTADKKTEDEKRTRDEVTEPPNSTVDDWLGQQVNRDEEQIDQLLDEAAGNEAEAERRFRSHENRPDRLPTEERRT